MTGFGKAVGMGPIARARILIRNFPMQMPASAVITGGIFPRETRQEWRRGDPFPRKSMSRTRFRRAETRAIKKERAFVERRSRSIIFVSTPAREFLIIWNVGKFFNSTIDPCRLIYDLRYR